MDYSYKLTTNGRAAIAACMALEKPLHITRIAFGSGKVDENVNLADMHQLIAYVSDGAVSERRHEQDRFYLTIQFANKAHPEVKTFLLSEFIIYVEDPVSGEETDLMYGTLGDYRQPVPAYNPVFPPSTFNFPLELIISDEINVSVSAPAGLVTYEELMAVMDRIAIRHLSLTVPAQGWTDTGEGLYPFLLELPLEVTSSMIPTLTVLPDSTAAAAICGLAPFTQTMEGKLRLWAEKVPEGEIHASLTLLRDGSGFCIGGGDPGTTVLLPATAERLGGVKVGSGLNVAEDGTLSVDTASDADINELLSEAFASETPGEEA